MKRIIAAFVIGFTIARMGIYGLPLQLDNPDANMGIILWVGPLATDHVCGIELIGYPGAFCGEE